MTTAILHVGSQDSPKPGCGIFHHRSPYLAFIHYAPHSFPGTERGSHHRNGIAQQAITPSHYYILANRSGSHSLTHRTGTGTGQDVCRLASDQPATFRPGRTWPSRRPCRKGASACQLPFGSRSYTRAATRLSSRCRSDGRLTDA